jgi:hypothetical protein
VFFRLLFHEFVLRTLQIPTGGVSHELVGGERFSMSRVNPLRAVLYQFSPTIEYRIDVFYENGSVFDATELQEIHGRVADKSTTVG